MARLKFTSSFLILMLLAMLASCSQGTSQVRLVVSQNFQFGSAALNTYAGGGLMVWGKNSDGSVFGQSLIDTDTITVPLTPGSWTFYAMAWDGSKNYDGSGGTAVPFGGDHFCAVSPVTSISSDAVNVQLTLAKTNCNKPVFAGSIGYVAEVPKFQPVFCQSIKGISSSNDLCADTTIDPNVKSGRAIVGSYRVNLMNFAGKGLLREIGKPGVSGACVPFTATNSGGPDSSSWYGVTAQNKMVPGLPAGEAGSPFHVQLEVFGSSDCDATPGSARGVITRNLPEGIARSGVRSASHPYVILNYSYRNYISIPSEDICSGRNQIFTGDHPFAWGNGSQNSPYVICSVPQFHKINSAPAYMSSSFKLGSDLDFNPYSKGIASASLPYEFNCLEIGTNFLPIGYVGANCAGPGNPMSWGTITNFSGSFDGGGFTLRNLRIRAEDKDHIGLFARFNGFQAQNLKFEKGEISGSSYVGLVAGQSDSGIIANLELTECEAEARNSGLPESYVGGLIGKSYNSEYQNISISNQRVRGESSYVGGAIGFHENSSFKIFKKFSVNADINANSPGTVNYVGGVIGRAINVDMSYVKHEGAILTNALKVGGILGMAEGATNLNNFYTMSFVQTSSSSTGLYLGGVVGYWDSIGNITKGYTLSQIKSNCTSSCVRGKVIGGVTTPPSTSSQLVVLNDTELGEPSLTSLPGEIIKNPLSTVRDASTFTSFPSAGTDDWSIVNYQYPRFDFEKHPCHDPTFTSGNGTSVLLPKKVCHEGEYIGLDGRSADSFYKLYSNIRLSNSNILAHEITNFNVTLLGNNKALIGGFSNSVGQTNTGHIRNLNGTIANLKIFGMSRKSNASDRLAPHGVFVANNYGTLQNIQSWTVGQWPTFNYGHGSLFVGHNHATGKISNVKIDGVMEAGDYDGIITVRNAGLIEDSKASGEYRCKEGAGCTYLAPLAVDNLVTGKIKRTIVESRIEQGFGPVSSASMMVIDNAGLIQDVEVSEHSRFQLADGAIGKLFHFTNTGKLERVMQNGEMITVNSNYGQDISNFPMNNDANSDPNFHNYVFRTGRSGVRLLGEVNFITSADGMYIEVDLSTLTSWNSAFAGGTYNPAIEPLMVLADFDGPGQFSGLVQEYDDTNNRLKIQGKIFTSGLSGNLSLYATNDPGFAVTTNVKAPGFIQMEDLETKDSFPLVWKDQIYDPSKPADQLALLDFYKSFVGITTGTIQPRTWELDDGSLRLFRVND